MRIVNNKDYVRLLATAGSIWAGIQFIGTELVKVLVARGHQHT